MHAYQVVCALNVDALKLDGGVGGSFGDLIEGDLVVAWLRNHPVSLGKPAQLSKLEAGHNCARKRTKDKSKERGRGRETYGKEQKHSCLDLINAGDLVVGWLHSHPVRLGNSTQLSELEAGHNCARRKQEERRGSRTETLRAY